MGKANKQKNIEEVKTIKGIIKKDYIFLILIVLLTFAVYGNLIRGDFLKLDDIGGVVQNPNIRDLGTALKTYNMDTVYLATVYKIFGLNAQAYHFFSILIHSINCILVFILISLLFDRKTAIITTLLFSVHSVNSEAVGWISARGYLYNTFLCLLILISWSLFKIKKQKKYFVIASALYAGNFLFSRDPWLLVIPIILILLDQFFFETKIKFKNIIYYFPILIVAGILVGTTVWQRFSQRVTSLEQDYYVNLESSVPYLNRLPYTVYMAAKLYLFPKDLTIYHEGEIITKVEYLLMTLSLVFAIGFCLYLLVSDRKKFAFFAAIPVSFAPSFAPVAIAWFSAERYLYLGSIFFCTLLTQYLIEFEKSKKMKNLVKVVVTLLVILYAVRSAIRTEDLRINKNLWPATKNVSPYSFRVYNNLGDVYADEGRYDEAIENFKMSVKLKPDYADAVHNIGYSYLQKGDMENAKLYLKKALEMNPRLYPAYYKIGYIYTQEGNKEEAIKSFEKCLELSPGNADCVRELNNVLSGK